MADSNDFGTGNNGNFPVNGGAEFPPPFLGPPGDDHHHHHRCFVAGARITTPDGHVQVEHLSIGDLVMTASGQARPVRWIGHRDIDCTRHPNPSAVWPIRVQAGAFGENQPSRDLWLSEGHSVCFDKILIPVGKLENGATVTRIPRDRIQYWHVELETHDVILAEDLAVESYLETGARAAFIEGGSFLELHPDFRPKHWSETCLPLMLEGSTVQRARNYLLERTSSLGYEITSDSDIHAVADGVRVEGFALKRGRIAFAFPETQNNPELRCRNYVPSSMIPGATDGRSLGVCVSRFQLDGTDLPLDEEGVFGADWHSLEGGGTERHRRWSKNSVTLPTGTRLLVVDLETGLYWRKAASLPTLKPALVRAAG